MRDSAAHVKCLHSRFAGFFCYLIGMSAPEAETLDDLIANAGMPLGVLAAKAKLDPWAILRLRKGTKSPHVKTLDRLATALRVKPARLRRAIAAQRSVD